MAYMCFLEELTVPKLGLSLGITLCLFGVVTLVKSTQVLFKCPFQTGNMRKLFLSSHYF